MLKGLSVALVSLVLGFSILGCDTADATDKENSKNGNPTNPIDPDPKDEPLKPEPKEFDPVENIELPTIDRNWTPETANAHVQTAMAQLIQQAADLEERYAYWESVLIADNGSSRTLINHVSTMKARQAAMQERNPSNWSTAGPIESVGALLNTNTQRIFTEYITVFRTASELAERQKNGDTYDGSTTLYMDLVSLKQAGGIDLTSKSKDYAAVIYSAKSTLTAMKPANAGEYYDDILQQFEDSTQFQGWREAMNALGISISE